MRIIGGSGQPKLEEQLMTMTLGLIPPHHTHSFPARPGFSHPLGDAGSPGDRVLLLLGL